MLMLAVLYAAVLTLTAKMELGIAKIAKVYGKVAKFLYYPQWQKYLRFSIYVFLQVLYISYIYEALSVYKPLSMSCNFSKI